MHLPKIILPFPQKMHPPPPSSPITTSFHSNHPPCRAYYSPSPHPSPLSARFRRDSEILISAPRLSSSSSSSSSSADSSPTRTTPVDEEQEKGTCSCSCPRSSEAEVLSGARGRDAEMTGGKPMPVDASIIAVPAAQIIISTAIREFRKACIFFKYA